jgi:hypothetical protein
VTSQGRSSPRALCGVGSPAPLAVCVHLGIPERCYSIPAVCSRLSSESYAGAVPALGDFDRYVAEYGIPEEDWPAAFALWIAESTGGPVPRFE